MKAALTKAHMWKAAVDCDHKYDGEFFYAVKTTGIFCRPSCKSKTPNYENICFFPNAEEARKEGFRPCKRCRPDLLEHTYDPHLEFIEDTKKYLQENYASNITIAQLAMHVGVSQYYLSRTFKEKTGYTPQMYLSTLRIQKAQELLVTTKENSTEICFQVGYQNFSSFYKQFKKICGCSPRCFRTEKGRKGN
ncbi:Ada metal-binding domain-containing protein [Virgibacillus halodenitrificans]|uniref:bifunctional transcriptional activator/DNA repair enzyme AdaA n=1 Tax=Virgibacillus TaxID=84406 RepID=UPI0009FFB13B|nr:MULTISPECIES: Ada metal-binding domain-containing protein [Virgibacillus]WHX28020.1 Ada metal-binding domain-containing protein [Virgibacillus halodenitrificans]